MKGVRQLRVLVEREWVKLEIPGKKGPYHSDVLFETSDRKVRIIGEPHMLKDNTDRYSLRIFSNGEDAWLPDWRDGFGARDLTQEWTKRPVARLFRAPRRVRFFTDLDFNEIGFYDREEHILTRCIALEFSVPEDPKPRLLITAELSNISLFIDEDCEEHLRKSAHYFTEYDPGPF